MADTDPTLIDASCPSAGELQEFIAGRLGTERTDAVALHVEQCVGCQRTLETLDDAEASIDAIVAPGGNLQFAGEPHCGRAVDAAARDSSAGGRTVIAPQRVGEFELLEPLGEGGMGTVHKARHASLGTTYAVKLLHPRRQADLSTIERFQREMVALGRLDHPNIVRAVDAGEESGVHYLVMEYIDGVDLGRALQARGPMSIANACEAARQAANGLAYVHRQGRVHRDVKPSNLMVATDGTVKLLDLGLARVEEYALDEGVGATDDILGGGSTVELTRTHQVMGTLEYMSPEQASNSKTVDEKADLYSLGCTLYKMLTGRSPFASDKSVTAMSQLLAHVEKPAPPVREHRPDIPAALAKLLEDLLAKNPQDRPKSAEDVAAALAPFAAGSDLAKLATIDQPQTERDTGSGSSKTVVLPRSDDRIEPKRSGLPWGPILLGLAGLSVLLLCPIGLAVLAFWLRGERVDYVATRDLQAVPVSVPAVEDPRVVPPGSVESEPVDLLALVDPQRDIRGNDWQLVDGGLVSQAATPSMMQFAYRPPDHYRWEATVERLENDESLEIGLSAGNAPLIILVDGYPGGGPYSGMYRLGDRNVTQHRENIHRGQVLRPGRPTRLAAWVIHQNGLVNVRLEADGREVFSWRGRTQRSRGTGHFPPTQPGVLFLGNWTASLRVSDVQVTPLTGTGEVIEFASPVENIDLAAAQRAVWKGGIVTLTSGREVTRLNELTSQDRVRAIDMQGSEWLNDQDLQSFASLNELERLNLSGTAVTNEGLRLMGPLPAVVELSLADTGVSRDWPQLASDFPALERLSLGATGVGNETLAGLNGLTGLTRLDVSATRVTDEGLANLEGLDQLQRLDLTQTSISDTGIDQLPPLPALVQLSLSGTRVREASALTREKFPLLARVTLLESDVSADAAARIRESLDGADVSTGTEATNLLSLIEPQRDGNRGSWGWAADGTSLRVPVASPARLAIPITLPPEFDLEVVAINNEGGRIHGPVFGLPLPSGGRPLVGFDHWPDDSNGPWTILHGVNGLNERDSPAKVSRDVFQDENPVRLMIRVRNDGVWIEQEGELILEWQGDSSTLAAGAGWFTADRTRPTISLFGTPYTIPELTLTPVTGRIGLPHFRPTHGGSDRSVAEWVLNHGGAVRVRYSDADSGAPEFAAGQSLPERPFWVTWIELSGGEIPREWLEDVGTLGRLIELNLPDTAFENADLAPLADAKTLEVATFTRTPLDDSGMEILSGLPKLSYLWIGDTNITADGIAHFSGHPSLRIIGAASPSLTDDVFAAAASIPNLVQLSLWRSSVTGEGLSHLEGHPALQRLYLGNTNELDPVHLNHLAGIPNLTAFQCAGNGLKAEDMEPLSRLTQLSDLRVHQNPLGDEGISRLSSLGNLTQLNMAGVGATNASLEALRGLSNLQILEISDNPGITDSSVAALLVHRNLRQLSLAGTGISQGGVRRLQSGLPGCQIEAGNAATAGGRTIDLSQRGVTDETLPLAIEGAPPTTLILEGPGITDVSMPLVASLPGLQRLKLDRTKVTNDGLAELVRSDALTRLELWNMPQITEPATAHIAAIPNLNQLVLKSTGIYGPGLERLHDKGLRGFYIGNKQLDRDMLEQYILPFGTLNTLDLAGTAIADEDVSLLLQMNLTNTLHLGWNQNITGPGLVHVADMPGVTQLNLDASGVTDEGLENVREAVQLERLIVRHTAVSDASVETIAALPNLNRILVSDTNFTSEGLARLRELLPNATITAEHLETPEGYPPPGAELVVDGGWKPTFSADGGELVYGLPQSTGLEILNLETGERRPLADEGKDSAWSPRGDWIACAREPFHNSNREEIWILRPDGSEERKVADGLYPFWIDGGGTVVFYSREQRGLMSIDIEQPDAEPEMFHASVPSFYCDATQNGAYLAWGYGGKVQVVERNSGEVVFEHEFVGDSTGLPSFSPDGKYLAYSPFGGDDRGVWVFDWRSGGAVRLNESNYWSPAWSPDGSQLAFDYRAPGTDTRETSVWIMNLAGRLPETNDE